MSTSISSLKGQSVSTQQLEQSFNNQTKAPQTSSRKSILKRGIAANKMKLVAVAAAALFFASCQKEQISNPMLNSTDAAGMQALAGGNTPPTVDAGPAKRMIYSSNSRSASANSATLYGRSSDKEGPVTVQWTQTAGASAAIIENPTSDTTNISGLQPGVYTFLLTAKDANGTMRKDSTSITVLNKMTWNIEGVTREALVCIPANTSAGAPVVFAFHGHGGSDLGFAERAFEANWPEAVVVYPQGLATKSPGDKDGKQTGWQHAVGEVNHKTGIKDQDIKFFDAMMSTFKSSFNINLNQVFVHGWSNGGEFTYDVLWTARGNQLTAIAPAAATVNTTAGKKQIPVMQIAGTGDPKVKFSNQQKSVQSVRTLDLCAPSGTTWATGPNKMLGTEYPSTINKNVVMLQYDGGHPYPFTVAPYIIQFFKDVAGL